MRRDRMKRLWRSLLPLERAELALTSYARGEAEDPLIRATLPVAHREAFFSLYESGALVLTHHRPMAAWLQSRIATIDAQLEALQVRSAWAAAAGVELSADVAARMDEEWELPDTVPTFVDLALLRQLTVAELIEQDVPLEDRKSWFAMVEVVGMLQRSWSILLALEEVVLVTTGRFQSTKLVALILGDAVRTCHSSLLAAHARAEMLLGPVALPDEPDEAHRRIRSILVSAPLARSRVR
ncbi:MAG: hypothetical protein WD942_11035 [Dehalococcoidia bacterium]